MARKRPRSFCQKCRWLDTLKHAYTFDPSKSEWADYAAVRAWCGKVSRNELTRDLSGNIRPQSSQLAEPVWADSVIKRVRELISPSKKEEEEEAERAGNEWSNILPKSSQARKEPPPPSNQNSSRRPSCPCPRLSECSLSRPQKIHGPTDRTGPGVGNRLTVKKKKKEKEHKNADRPKF